MLFRSEEWIARWCKSKNVEPGETLSVEQVWELSQLWYRNRLSPQYRGRTAAQAEAIFKQLGFASPFWFIAEGAGAKQE